MKKECILARNDNNEIEAIVTEIIAPYSLNETGKRNLRKIVKQYPYDLLVECIDIGADHYLQYDDDGKLLQKSVNTFLDKLGGIAYNKSRNPVEQEINHQKNKCKQRFSYWNEYQADAILNDYVSALKNAGYSELQILNDLKVEVNRLSNKCTCWSDWREALNGWIDDIKHWKDEDNITIEQAGTIIPDSLINGLQINIQTVCKQINAAYEANLYDCAAVMMRRLLEGLLVLSYQNLDIESEIMNNNGKRHFTLDKIIKNAVNNEKLCLSGNAKDDLEIFKDLGNYSAHKIWYSCTQQDIKPHILKYRTIIEELFHKGGLR